MNYTYLLRCADDSLYCGWTNHLEQRIKMHNSGKGAKYTKSRRPVALAYFEAWNTKEEAMKREAAIKKMTKNKKEALAAELRIIISPAKKMQVRTDYLPWKNMPVFLDRTQVLKEKLWMIETNGKKTQLELPDFYSVEKAAVSADGRYIGILDSGIENKVLYVYDMQDNILHNLGEEGLGTITTSFAWDAEKPVVYAMSGLGTSQGANALQLVKYDFSKEAGSRVDAIGGEMPGADSKITLVGGKIYFVDKGTQEIYSVDIATESREVVAQGIDFAVAPDGNNIAAVVPVVEEGEGSEDVTFNIVITNLSTKEQTEVIQGIGEGESPSLGFDAGSDILYFTMYSYEGATPEYQVAILKYTISTAELSLLEYSKTERIMPGLNAGEIYIINYYSQNEDSFYVTYVQTEK